jgi:hypothetical protein
MLLYPDVVEKWLYCPHHSRKRPPEAMPCHASKELYVVKKNRFQSIPLAKFSFMILYPKLWCAIFH